jgi:hypothetical protein
MPDTPQSPGNEPQRVSLLDVITLSPVEAYAVLVSLANEPDPAVAEALAGAIACVLARTRG